LLGGLSVIRSTESSLAQATIALTSMLVALGGGLGHAGLALWRRLKGDRGLAKSSLATRSRSFTKASRRAPACTRRSAGWTSCMPAIPGAGDSSRLGGPTSRSPSPTTTGLAKVRRLRLSYSGQDLKGARRPGRALPRHSRGHARSGSLSGPMSASSISSSPLMNGASSPRCRRSSVIRPEPVEGRHRVVPFRNQPASMRKAMASRKIVTTRMR
jgi:hypothetical protein